MPGVFQVQSELDKALKTYQRSLDINVAAYGTEEHADVASTLFNLACLQEGMGALSDALAASAAPLLRRSTVAEAWPGLAEQRQQELFGGSISSSSFHAVVVVGWGEDATSRVAQHVHAVTGAERDAVLEQEASDRLSPALVAAVIADVLASGFVAPYRLEDVSAGVREDAQRAVDDLVRALVTGRASLAVVPQLVFLLPFLASASERLADGGVVPLLAAQDGFAAALGATPAITDTVGPLLVDESAIDKLCLMRLRQWTAPGRTGEPTEAGLELELEAADVDVAALLDVEVAHTASRQRGGARPCSVEVDVPAMRQAVMWSMASAAALAFPARLLVVRVEDLDSPAAPASERIRVARVDEALRAALGDGGDAAARTSSEAPRTSSEVPRPDGILLAQLRYLISRPAMLALGYAWPPPLQPTTVPAAAAAAAAAAATKEEAPRPAVDAGFCEATRDVSRLSSEAKRNPTLSVATCLPSALVLGAQKAGTDELGVWVNKNAYLRRLDGGVEIHFFDCVGRGAGHWRAPCGRPRRSRMRLEARATLGNLSAALEKDQLDAFAWSSEREKSPYVSSHWRSYLALGNLYYVSRHVRHTKTFEKTPAYMDLAHPMDVLRVLPRVRLVFMLRDPAARFVSSYFQTCSGKHHSRGACSYDELERFVDDVIVEGIVIGADGSGGADVYAPGGILDAGAGASTEAQEGSLGDPVVVALRRALAHSVYAHWLVRWRLAFADAQIMVVFSEQFKRAPQAVVFAVEAFLGLTKSKQHAEFHPRQTPEGFWVLGDYSKAHKPSHKEAPPPALMAKLQRFFRPWNRRLAELLIASDIVMRPIQPLPSALGSAAVFDWPEWLSAS